MNSDNPTYTPPPVPPQPTVVEPKPQAWGMPSVITVRPEAPTTETSHPKIPRKAVNVFGVIFIFVITALFVGVTGVMAALVAYDKVTLGNADMQTAIRQAVLSLPFTPKTPAYVLQNTILSMSKATTTAVDGSIAISSPVLTPLTGSSNLDVTAKGVVDFLDKTNFKTQLTLQAGSFFSADLRTANQKGYIKVNTFPTKLVQGVLPFPDEVWNNIFSNWIVWESDSVDTEARQLVDARMEESNKQVEKQALALLGNQTIMKKITLSTEQLDGATVYKLHPTIDSEFVTAFVDTLPTEELKANAQTTWLDAAKELQVDIYVDTNTYLLHKVSVSFSSRATEDLLSPVSSFIPQLTGSDYSIAAVLKLSNYGRPFVFDPPKEPKSWQEIVAMMTGGAEPVAENLTPQQKEAQARDMKRKEDLTEIGNIVTKYASEHEGELPDLENKDFPDVPVCIGTGSKCFDLAKAGRLNGTVVPLYTTKLPLDPKGGTTTDSKYTIYLNTQNRIVLEAQSELTPTQKITVTR